MLADFQPPVSFHDIKHVVLLMQKNRSFDHYFGTLAGIRGFDDPKALQLHTGKSVFHQPDVLRAPDGHLLPLHLDTSYRNAQKLPSITTDGQRSTKAGTAARWVTGFRPTVR